MALIEYYYILSSTTEIWNQNNSLSKLNIYKQKLLKLYSVITNFFIMKNDIIAW